MFDSLKKGARGAAQAATTATFTILGSAVGSEEFKKALAELGRLAKEWAISSKKEVTPAVLWRWLDLLEESGEKKAAKKIRSLLKRAQNEGGAPLENKAVTFLLEVVTAAVRRAEQEMVFPDSAGKNLSLNELNHFYRRRAQRIRAEVFDCLKAIGGYSWSKFLQGIKTVDTSRLSEVAYWTHAGYVLAGNSLMNLQKKTVKGLTGVRRAGRRAERWSEGLLRKL